MLLNFQETFKHLETTLPVFVKNTLLMLHDVGLHSTPSPQAFNGFLKEPGDAIANVVVEHARLSREIISMYSFDKIMLLYSNENAINLHLRLGNDCGIAERLKELRRFTDHSSKIAIDFRNLSASEKKERGYDVEKITTALEFSMDDYSPRYLDSVLEKKNKESWRRSQKQ